MKTPEILYVVPRQNHGHMTSLTNRRTLIWNKSIFPLSITAANTANKSLGMINRTLCYQSRLLVDSLYTFLVRPHAVEQCNIV